MKNVEKIVEEIAKIKVKISDLQNKLRDLERQKLEAENFNIVMLVRGMELEPDKLRAFIEAYKKENTNAADAPLSDTAAGEEESSE